MMNSPARRHPFLRHPHAVAPGDFAVDVGGQRKLQRPQSAALRRGLQPFGMQVDRVRADADQFAVPPLKVADPGG